MADRLRSVRRCAGRVVFALGALLVAPMAAQALQEDTADPIERAAFIALPSTYAVSARIQVQELSDALGSTKVRREVILQGMAFGVGPRAVVTARHIVRPSASTLLRRLQLLGVDKATRFDPNDVRVTSKLLSISLQRTGPYAQSVPDTTRARIEQLTSIGSSADLALLTTSGEQGPALALDDGTTRGTPVAVIGFGADAPVPRIQFGEISLAARTAGNVDEGLVTIAGVDAQPTDAGAPIIGQDGRVRGVLVRRGVAAGELAVMTQASVIRQLGANAHVELRSTTPQTEFASGMQAYWNRKYSDASEGLQHSAQTIPQSAWIDKLAKKAEQLATAEYVVVRISPWRIPLIMAGLIAMAITALLAIRFWTMDE